MFWQLRYLVKDHCLVRDDMYCLHNKSDNCKTLHEFLDPYNFLGGCDLKKNNDLKETKICNYTLKS